MKAILCKLSLSRNGNYSVIATAEGKGNRVKITREGDHSYRDAAIALCRKNNWKGKLISGDLKDGTVFVFLPLDLLLASKGRSSEDVIDVDSIDRLDGFIGRNKKKSSTKES